jgi:hypothetical protein
MALLGPYGRLGSSVSNSLQTGQNVTSQARPPKATRMNQVAAKRRKVKSRFRRQSALPPSECEPQCASWLKFQCIVKFKRFILKRFRKPQLQQMQW